MFQIDKNDIPFLRTRAAVLILDVQNDIVAPEGVLKVNQPPDFLDNIYNLVPIFRSWGQIMWILTQFEKHRAINDDSNDAESVITDKELSRDGLRARQRERMSEIMNKARAHYSEDNEAGGNAESQALDIDGEDEEEDEDEDEEVNETYLTLGPNEQPKCCIPMSLGVNFHTSMLQGPQNGLNSLTDLIFGKTHYSAFSSGALIQRLRSSMVTELFICGALTNISIYATVLDAVRHGYSITIISDCCGYKSQARHSEAMRQMTECLGCDTVTSLEIMEEIQARERPRENPKGMGGIGGGEAVEQNKGKTKAIENNPTKEIDELMGKLDLRDDMADAEATPFQPEPETIKSHLWEVKPQFPASHSTDDDDMALLPPEFLTPSLLRREPSANKVRVKAKISTRRRSSKPKPKDESTFSLDLKPESSARAQKTRTASTQKEMPELEKPTLDNKVPVTSKTSMAETEVKGEPHRPIHSASFCEGDSEMITNLFPGSLANQLFKNLLHEVIWQKMFHQSGDVPRLVAVQGLVFPDGTHPLYRHPSDESPPLYPFSETVRQIIPYVESALGHTVNHVLIQFYRDGTDHITEHSDKTLDIVPGTFIANVSLGAQRTMTFRTKKPITPTEQSSPEGGGVPLISKSARSSSQEGSAKADSALGTEASTEPPLRTTHRERLPHNSMCKFGLKSNAVWLHGIRPDRRPDSEKSSRVLAFNGSRISLTFRKIGTFLNRNQTLIWGQGAVAKDEENAREVISGNTQATRAMLKAFGRENKMGSEFVWKSEYRDGFDVLHIKNERKLVLGGGDGVGDMRVKILLRELRLAVVICGEGDLMRPIRLDIHGKEVVGDTGKKKVTFVDNDGKRSRVEGDAAIFLYLDRLYSRTSGNGYDIGKGYTRLLQAANSLQNVMEDLPLWESFILEHGSEGYIAGPEISLVDYFFWPALHCLQRNFGDSEVLKSYYERVGERDSIRWVNEAVSDSD